MKIRDVLILNCESRREVIRIFDLLLIYYYYLTPGSEEIDFIKIFY